MWFLPERQTTSWNGSHVYMVYGYPRRPPSRLAIAATHWIGRHHDGPSGQGAGCRDMLRWRPSWCDESLGNQLGSLVWDPVSWTMLAVALATVFRSLVRFQIPRLGGKGWKPKGWLARLWQWHGSGVVEKKHHINNAHSLGVSETYGIWANRLNHPLPTLNIWNLMATPCRECRPTNRL